MPVECAIVDVNGNCRIGEKTLVVNREMTAHGHPRLLLCRAPVGELKLWVIAAGYPCLTARAENIVELTPRIAAWLIGLGYSVEAPFEFASVSVVGADIAVVLYVTSAAR